MKKGTKRSLNQISNQPKISQVFKKVAVTNPLTDQP